MFSREHNISFARQTLLALITTLGLVSDLVGGTTVLFDFAVCGRTHFR